MLEVAVERELLRVPLWLKRRSPQLREGPASPHEHGNGNHRIMRGVKLRAGVSGALLAADLEHNLKLCAEEHLTSRIERTRCIRAVWLKVRDGIGERANARERITQVSRDAQPLSRDVPIDTDTRGAEVAVSIVAWHRRHNRSFAIRHRVGIAILKSTDELEIATDKDPALDHRSILIGIGKSSLSRIDLAKGNPCAERCSIELKGEIGGGSNNEWVQVAIHRGNTLIIVALHRLPAKTNERANLASAPAGESS